MNWLRRLLLPFVEPYLEDELDTAYDCGYEDAVEAVVGLEEKGISVTALLRTRPSRNALRTELYAMEDRRN